MPRYLDDFRPGLVFESPPRTVTEEAIVRFAREFDPQPMHLGRAAAEAGAFGRLVASGWHTAALTMRLITEAGLDIAGGIVGAGVESLRWPHPLEPDDRVHVRLEVLEVRPSRSKPEIGLMRVKIEALAERAGPVEEAIVTVVVPRRPGVSAVTRDPTRLRYR